MWAIIDEVTSPELKSSVKLEPFTGYEIEDVNRFLKKYSHRLNAKDVRLSPGGLRIWRGRGFGGPSQRSGRNLVLFPSTGGEEVTLIPPLTP